MRTALVLLLTMAGLTGFAVGSLILVTKASLWFTAAIASFLLGGGVLVRMALEQNTVCFALGAAVQLTLAFAVGAALVHYGHALNEWSWRR